MSADPAPSTTSAPEPSGIGGWLLLPFLGLVLTAIFAVWTLKQDVLPAFGSEVWSELTTPGSEIYHALWAPYLALALIANLALLFGSITLLVMGMRKHRWFPKLMIVFYLAVVVCALIDVLGAESFLKEILPVADFRDFRFEAYRDLVRAIGIAALWGTYFRVSERVKNTFVN